MAARPFLVSAAVTLRQEGPDMRRERDGLQGIGGISLIGIGMLVLTRHLLELRAGRRPRTVWRSWPG
jgi:hypothetical protein